MVTVGERLREERNRIGLSQTDFATVGHVTKKSQGLYEKNERSPTAEYLSALETLNVDVAYVVTGTRSVFEAVNENESVLLDSFRNVNDELQDALIHLALGLYREKLFNDMEFAENFTSQESIAELVAKDSPDVNILKRVIERVEQNLEDEQIALLPDQKARVIVACFQVSLKEGGNTDSSHVSTAIRAVM